VSRLDAIFRQLREKRRKALVPFITAGDPDPATTVSMLHALVRGGADIVELGVPFSDPEADGPVIQAASERALAAGFKLAQVFDIVREFRRDDERTPVVLMGYLNSVERVGYEHFASMAGEAGVDGLILVNVPPEEGGELKRAFAAAAIDIILLLAPTTTMERARYLLSQSAGFVYFVSLKGVTGASNLDVDDVGRRVAALREYTALPILVGFGIKDGASARAVAAFADGVVIGAALVSTVASLNATPAAIPDALERQLRGLRTAMDQ
jgi:tryptophan synthase alpha chain